MTAGTGTDYRVVTDTSAAGDTVWVAVIAPQGNGLASGEIARLAVPDTRQAGAYRADLSDVAAADYAAADPTELSLTVVKP